MKANRKPRIFTSPTITKTMFFMEGNPAAILITNNGGLLLESMMEFSQAETALDWCCKNVCTLVYTPASLSKN
jgi:hypothetical protein